MKIDFYKILENNDYIFIELRYLHDKDGIVDVLFLESFSDALIGQVHNYRRSN